MWCSDLFNELLPVCSGCQSPFDMRCCSPQILPCAHTLCLACVTSDSKTRKRRCLTCDKRYTTFHLNTALGETIERIRVRREALDSQSRRCDECEKRAYLSWMRRCITCEIQLKEAQLTSVICMECCVDRHNGHALRVVSADAYVLKEEKIGHSVSVCGSTSSSNQYRSTLSGHSSMVNSPRLPSSHNSSRLHSTSSTTSSGAFSSGGLASSPGASNPIDTRNGIGQKVSSFLHRVTARSCSPHHTSMQQQQPAAAASGSPTATLSSSPSSQLQQLQRQPPLPTVTLPVVPSPSRSSLRSSGRGGGGTMTPSSFRQPHPVMGTAGLMMMTSTSPYMTPNGRAGAAMSLKKSLDHLDSFVRRGDILREETSPFYEGQSLYGVSLLVGGVCTNSSLSSTTSLSSAAAAAGGPPLQHAPAISDVMAAKRKSLPMLEGDYHKLSPYPGRRTPIVDRSPVRRPFPAAVAAGGDAAAGLLHQSPLANMPRRDPRIRGGPAHLQDDAAAAAESRHDYENSQHATEQQPAADAEKAKRGVLKSLQQQPAYFDRHQLQHREKQVRRAAAVAAPPTTLVTHHPPGHYINVTRSCENLPSQFSKLDLNNNDGEAKQQLQQLQQHRLRVGGVRRVLPPQRSAALFGTVSDHCCSYEYIGS